MWTSDSSTDLFRDYMCTMAKGKVESSGWPAACADDEGKAEYVKRYVDIGVQVEGSQIQSKPALRSLFKLLLNRYAWVLSIDCQILYC